MGVGRSERMSGTRQGRVAESWPQSISSLPQLALFPSISALKPPPFSLGPFFQVFPQFKITVVPRDPTGVGSRPRYGMLSAS